MATVLTSAFIYSDPLFMSDLAPIWKRQSGEVSLLLLILNFKNKKLWTSDICRCGVALRGGVPLSLLILIAYFEMYP